MAMFASKLVGRQAASRKYDLIAALGAHALAGGPGRQKLVLRLLTLITARYNWSTETLSVGQRDIARLWSVDPRTVKREMAKLREIGWLVLERQGARGRVAEYRLDLAAIWAATSDEWSRIGPDFEERLGAERKVVRVDFGGAAPKGQGGTPWDRICARLHDDEPGLYASWVSRLSYSGADDGILRLSAPNDFIARYVAQHLTEKILRHAAPEGLGLRCLDVAVDG